MPILKLFFDNSIIYYTYVDFSTKLKQFFNIDVLKPFLEKDNDSSVYNRPHIKLSLIGVVNIVKHIYVAANGKEELFRDNFANGMEGLLRDNVEKFLTFAPVEMLHDMFQHIEPVLLGSCTDFDKDEIKTLIKMGLNVRAHIVSVFCEDASDVDGNIFIRMCLKQWNDFRYIFIALIGLFK